MIVHGMELSKFIAATEALLSDRERRLRVASRYSVSAVRKYRVTLEQAMADAWPRLIHPIDDDLAKLGVHPGNATIH